MQGCDVARMSWAEEIYWELCREETHEALEEVVWYECEEWPWGEFDCEDFETKNAQKDTQECGKGFTKHGRRSEKTHATDIISLQQTKGVGSGTVSGRLEWT